MPKGERSIFRANIYHIVTFCACSILSGAQEDKHVNAHLGVQDELRNHTLTDIFVLTCSFPSSNKFFKLGAPRSVKIEKQKNASSVLYGKDASFFLHHRWTFKKPFFE